MIADVTKDALIPSLYSEAVEMDRVLLSITTLVLYFVASIEAYLWLNPTKDYDIESRTAIFKAILLLLYVSAIIVHAFLYAPLKLQLTLDSVIFWCKSYSTILFIYFLYNFAWLVRNLLERLGIYLPDHEEIKSRKLLLYSLHYILFFSIFYIIEIFISLFNIESVYVVVICIVIIVSIYLVSYFLIWWNDWHKESLKFEEQGNLY